MSSPPDQDALGRSSCEDIWSIYRSLPAQAPWSPSTHDSSQMADTRTGQLDAAFQVASSTIRSISYLAGRYWPGGHCPAATGPRWPGSARSHLVAAMAADFGSESLPYHNPSNRTLQLAPARWSCPATGIGRVQPQPALPVGLVWIRLNNAARAASVSLP